MADKYMFNDLIKDVLEKSKVPLTANEIWDKAVEYEFDKKLQTKGKTPWATIGERLYTHIKYNSNNLIFYIASKNPTRFYLTKYKNEVININDEYYGNNQKEKKVKFNERKLHTLLTKFVSANSNFLCVTKTIYHESSIKEKKGKNRWIHPDIVGAYLGFDDYEENTIKLFNEFGKNIYKLFSFELKIELNFSNLRECYFQTVSNSSWANEGYLVALKVNRDDDFLKELQTLNNAFGIGVICLDVKNIAESEILYPARKRETIDINSFDRLLSDNVDFKKFITDILDDIKIKNTKGSYDKILNDDEYEKYINDEHILD